MNIQRHYFGGLCFLVLILCSGLTALTHKNADDVKLTLWDSEYGNHGIDQARYRREAQDTIVAANVAKELQPVVKAVENAATAVKQNLTAPKPKSIVISIPTPSEVVNDVTKFATNIIGRIFDTGKNTTIKITQGVGGITQKVTDVATKTATGLFDKVVSWIPKEKPAIDIPKVAPSRRRRSLLADEAVAIKKDLADITANVKQDLTASKPKSIEINIPAPSEVVKDVTNVASNLVGRIFEAGKSTSTKITQSVSGLTKKVVDVATKTATGIVDIVKSFIPKKETPPIITLPKITLPEIGRRRRRNINIDLSSQSTDIKKIEDVIASGSDLKIPSIIETKDILKDEVKKATSVIGGWIDAGKKAVNTVSKNVGEVTKKVVDVTRKSATSIVDKVKSLIPKKETPPIITLPKVTLPEIGQHRRKRNVNVDTDISPQSANTKKIEDVIASGSDLKIPSIIAKEPAKDIVKDEVKKATSVIGGWIDVGKKAINTVTKSVGEVTKKVVEVATETATGIVDKVKSLIPKKETPPIITIPKVTSTEIGPRLKRNVKVDTGISPQSTDTKQIEDVISSGSDLKIPSIISKEPVKDIVKDEVKKANSVIGGWIDAGKKAVNTVTQSVGEVTKKIVDASKKSVLALVDKVKTIIPGKPQKPPTSLPNPPTIEIPKAQPTNNRKRRKRDIHEETKVDQEKEEEKKIVAQLASETEQPEEEKSTKTSDDSDGEKESKEGGGATSIGDNTIIIDKGDDEKEHQFIVKTDDLTDMKGKPADEMVAKETADKRIDTSSLDTWMDATEKNIHEIKESVELIKENIFGPSIQKKKKIIFEKDELPEKHEEQQEAAQGRFDISNLSGAKLSISPIFNEFEGTKKHKKKQLHKKDKKLPKSGQHGLEISEKLRGYGAADINLMEHMRDEDGGYDVTPNGYWAEFENMRIPFVGAALKFITGFYDDIKSYETFEKHGQTYPKFCGKHCCAPFKVVCKNDFYEVRKYPDMTLASSFVTGQEYIRCGLKPAIYRLFSYLQGTNDKGVKMPITVPFVINPPPQRINCPKRQLLALLKNETFGPYVTMALEPPFDQDPPKYEGTEIKIWKLKNAALYVRMFGGYATPQVFYSKAKEFLEILKLNDQKVEHRPMAALYDKPSVFVGRHNEIFVPIDDFHHSKNYC